MPFKNALVSGMPEPADAGTKYTIINAMTAYRQDRTSFITYLLQPDWN
jgi:hypothetical protein